MFSHPAEEILLKYKMFALLLGGGENICNIMIHWQTCSYMLNKCLAQANGYISSFKGWMTAGKGWISLLAVMNVLLIISISSVICLACLAYPYLLVCFESTVILYCVFGKGTNLEGKGFVIITQCDCSHPCGGFFFVWLILLVFSQCFLIQLLKKRSPQLKL